MTFKLSCGDVMPGCIAEFEAPDEATLMRDVAAHARSEHGLEPSPELTRTVGEHVRPD